MQLIFVLFKVMVPSQFVFFDANEAMLLNLPVSIDNKVVFPPPLAPIIPYNSPGFASPDILSNIVTDDCFFDKDEDPLFMVNFIFLHER